MGKDVIVALDFDSKEKTLAFLDRFTEEKPFVKIGMELFYAEGPSIVREIRGRGHKIFLDLKLHDIPNTVKKAMAALSALDVDIVNLHAAGTAAKVRHRQAARHRNDDQYRHHHCLMTEQLARPAVHLFDPFVLFALCHSKTSQHHRVRKGVPQQPRSKTGFCGQTKS